MAKMYKIFIDLAAGAALLMIPSAAVLGLPAWYTGTLNFAICGALALAYIFSGVLSTICNIKSVGWRMALALMPLPPVFLGLLLLPDAVYSRRLLLASTAMYVVLQFIRLSPVWKYRVVKVAVVAVVTLAFSASALLQVKVSSSSGEESRTTSVFLSTSHHTVEISEYDIGPLTGLRSEATGGGITFDSSTQRYFLVRPHGEVYEFDFGADGESLELDDTGLRVPINHETFVADNSDKESAVTFRVADVVVLGNGADRRILVSHHFWQSARACFVVRLSQHAFPEPGKNNSATSEGWTTLFETEPCLPLESNRGSIFAGAQIGGNLELGPTGRIIFTVGDHQYDGWYHARNLVEDMAAHYGKVISIDPLTGDHEVFTTGHRNPQGLVVTSSGTIWATEHGPEGGDELNRLGAGRNYGYPFHSLGTEYGGVTWPPGRHTDDATAIEVSPVYAWLPSIGISDLVEINGSGFPSWQGDLLVASLGNRAVWRIRTQEGRVLFAERIQVGRRIRDIAANDREVVLWTDSSTLMRISRLEDIDDGATLFALRCGGCHDDNDDRIGPTLRGFSTRPVGTSPTYDYSPAFRGLGGLWTKSRLDELIRDPNEFAPGTKMVIQNVDNPEERRMIVEYLLTL